MKISSKKRKFFFKSQSNDRELQRQRCKKIKAWRVFGIKMIFFSDVKMLRPTTTLAL
jgi:hypothetical protein